MIGLDTNILVRYITLDDPIQSPVAVRFVDTLSADEPGFISLVVTAELAWVLDVSYKFKQAAIVRVFESLLQSRELIVEQTEVVSRALRLYATGHANLADCLIERGNSAAGCMQTLTFDQKAARAAGMLLLK